MRFFISRGRVLSAVLAAALTAAPTILPALAVEQGVGTTVTAENLTEDIFEPLPEEAAPAAGEAELQLTSKSAILAEKRTGKILYEHNSHEKLAPASVTKIMSLILIFEALDRGDLGLDTEIAASEYASGMGGSQIWLKEGEVMTVDELLKATVIASANDATVALAEAVAGSEEVFVGMMNEKAAELGMEDTVFKNSTGLDAEGHLTSAYDIMLMSRELLRHELILDYSTVWMDTLRGGKSQLVNTNKLVRFYEGTLGLKTGTTSKAGYCLSAAAERDGMTLISVIMDAPSSKLRFSEARTLLSYGFAGYTYKSFTVPAEELRKLPVSGGTEKTVSVRAVGEAELLLKRNGAELTHITELKSELEAPVAAGEEVGVCRIFSGDEEVGRIKLVTAEACERLSFFTALLRLLAQMAVI